MVAAARNEPRPRVSLTYRWRVTSDSEEMSQCTSARRGSFPESPEIAPDLETTLRSP